MSSDLRLFADRYEAGVQLAREVRKLQLQTPLTVLGLPRGGVPVAYEIARALSAPLDVIVVRKIGLPGQSELAIGAIAVGNIVVRLSPALSSEQIPFEQLARQEQVELERRERRYRTDMPPLNLTGSTVILVDDGVATGCTMIAAARSARKARARRIIVSTPVASAEAAARVSQEADVFVALEIPAHLRAIGEWYRDFAQVEDREVCSLLERARDTASARSA